MTKLAIILYAVSVSARYDENILLTRLLGGFRMEFYKSEKCRLSQEQGEMWFEYNPTDSNLVPDECVTYVEDEDAAYNPIVRPVTNYTHALDVEMALTLLQIIELNERQQSLMTSVMHDIRWVDQYLKWRPSMNGGVKSIIIPAEEIWTPDILHYQSVFEEFDSKYESNVEVRFDGTCSWLPPAILYSSCEVDMTYFPFDIQTCPLKFGSWSYTKSLVNLKIAYPTNNIIGQGQSGELLIDQGQYIRSSTWELLTKKAMLHEMKYDCCPQIYIDITYYLKLKRFTYYPTLTLVLPCALTAMLVVLTFILPPEAGEKVSLNITILLAMVVFMDQLSQQTPPMSSNLPLIGKFFVASMIIISISMVSTILCLKLHHTHRRDGKPMSRWARCFVLEMMPMLLCMTPPAQAETTEWPCSNDDEIHYTAASEVYKGTSELSYIYNEVKFISDRLRVQEAQIAYEDEWKYAALVLDRFCAWVFLGGLTFSFVATICVTPNYE